MSKIHKHALVAYSAQQMFDLVNDVDKYDTFVPGCRRSKVLEQSDTFMKATLLLNKAGIEQELITLNKLESGRSIDMTLGKGPFKSFSGGWTFTPMDEDSCKIELKLDFTFNSRLVEFAFGKVFKALANSMVSAFTQRAKKVYG